MLILTRKEDESIKIGDNILIKVISISGNQVKLGIDAPKNSLIFRYELYEKIKQENLESSKIDIAYFNKIKEIIK